MDWRATTAPRISEFIYFPDSGNILRIHYCGIALAGGRQPWPDTLARIHFSTNTASAHYAAKL